MAQVQVGKTYNLQMLADEIDKRNGLANRATIIYVLQELADVLQAVLVGGDAADLGGLVTLKPSIRGTMQADGTFSDGSNTLAVTASVGPVLKDATLRATPEKIGGTALPTIESVANEVDYTEGVLYGGGTNAAIRGKFLNFDPSASDEGVFLSCPEYEGDDLAVTVLKSEGGEIKCRIDGAIDAEYAAYLIFKTRQGDKNAEPVEMKQSITLKPKPMA